MWRRKQGAVDLNSETEFTKLTTKKPATSPVVGSDLFELVLWDLIPWTSLRDQSPRVC